MVTPRAAARGRSELTYIGNPCRQGHRRRYVANGNCVSCAIRRATLPTEAAKARTRSRRWANANKTRVLANLKDWARKNPEKRRAYQVRYRQRHLEQVREDARRRAASTRKEQPQVRRYYESLRRARLRHATPIWVSREDLKRVYLSCPNGLQVDHVVPLAGRNVCGLHVPWNLQYLSPAENSRKGNRAA